MRANALAVLALTFLMLPISCEKSIRKVNNKNLIKMNKMEQKADYRNYVPFILRWEGGVSDNASDRGGLTYKGITHGTYNVLCKTVLKKDPNKNHFLNLTDEEVGLFVKHYWDKSTNNNQIKSQKIAEAITSWHWGSGRLGLMWYQQMLNKEYNCKLVVNGIIDNASIVAINSIDPDSLFQMSIKYRYNRFHQICKQNPSQKIFLKGWLNRLRDFAERHGELDFYNEL
jgi:lysozyme family protein